MYIRVKIIAFCFLILSSLCVTTSAFADTTFTTEQKLQMTLAWSKAGRNINDNNAALSAWAALGGSYDDFIKMAQTAPPDWNPGKSYAEMSTLANGYTQYTDLERLQMGSAWLPRDINNYAAAINAWATLGGTAADFIKMAQSMGPDWNPAQDLTNMETAWILNGHNLEDFFTAYQTATRLGMSPNDIIEAIKNDPHWDPGIEERQRLAEEERQRQLAEQQRLAEENAQLLQQYNDFRDELQKYQDLWNEVTDKINNQEDIDWDDIARRMGIEPSTPDDIYKRLGELKYYYEVGEDSERARTAAGQSPEDYMRWILGQTTDANGKTCADPAYNNCYSQTRNKLDEILNQPGIKPPAAPQKRTDFSDISSIIDNFHAQLPAFIHLLYALSYTIGFLFMIIALFRLKEYGANPMYRQPGLITSCLSYFVAGVMLIYLPSALDVGAATFLADNGDNSLFSYTAVKNKGFGYEELVSPVVDIVKIVGLLAFIRGWVMLSKMGNEQHKGVMFKGLMHVFGGILAVNILGVYTLFARVFVRVFSG
jgi:intracellular multiplication protein IcmC